MAQISKGPNSSNRPNRPGSGGARKAGSPATKSGANKPAASRASTASSSGRPPARKPGKSIVNQKQTPWGLIATALILVLFAGGIVAYAVTRHKDSSGVSAADAPYVQAEVPAAKAISGIIWKKHIQHNHVAGVVKYDSSPPMGGNHNQYWANCTGTVYTKQIANENAVHMLEHGAVWVTYNPATISAADLKTITADVDGVQWMALSPYKGLKTEISLQAWNYQLFVTKASDPRVEKFIDALKHTTKVTPEYGAACSGSGFVAAQSYPGHPYDGGA